MIKHEVYLLLENLNQLKSLSIYFMPAVLVRLIFIPIVFFLKKKPDSNCFNSFTLPSVDKVTTET